MTDQGEALGIDVGGTKINAFRVARDGEILARAQVPTPADDQEATVAAMRSQRPYSPRWGPGWVRGSPGS